MLTLDNSGRFVTVDGTKLGIVASQKRGRWQYRDATSGTVYASGMTPDKFAAQFWFRNDFQYPATPNN